MTINEPLLTISPQFPCIMTNMFTAMLITYGGYSYGQEYSITDQWKEDKVVLMGRFNYQNSTFLEKDYWNYSYIEIKVSGNLQYELLKISLNVKAEETQNSIQVFQDEKYLQTIELKGREKQKVDIILKEASRSFKILIRPVFPYPRPLSFYSCEFSTP